MGKHVKKKNSALHKVSPAPSRALRDTGEDNIDVNFDFFSVEEAPPAPEAPAAEAPVPVAEVPADGADPVPVAEALPAEAPAYEAPELPESARRSAAPPVKTAARKKTAPKKRPAGTSGGKKPGRRKKRNAFRRGLFIYVCILAVCIAGVLTVLWTALDRSQKEFDAEAAEKAQIEAEKEAQEAQERAVYQAPQRCFESWLATCTPAYWAEQWAQTPAGALDGADNVLSEMTRLFDPAVMEAFKSLDYTDEKPIYVLKNGDETLARITLAGGGTDWAVDQVEFLVKGEQSASVRVSTGSRVYCNGIELGEEFITDSSSYFDYEPLRDQLIDPVTWNTYTVEGLLLEPNMTVEPVAGSSVTETAEGDFLLCLDDDSAATYQNQAVTFVKSYLYYYMSGYNGAWGNLYNALAYLTPGTQAYQDLYDTYEGVVWNTAYGNIDTSDTTAGGVVIWADNCYSVDVTYDANCTLNGQAIDYADATMRIYFLRTDSGFIISNFETL